MSTHGKGRIIWEPSPRRVRVRFHHQWLADSTDVMLLLEKNHLPVYYFPRADVRMDYLQSTDHSSHCPHKGDAVYWTLRVGDRLAENAAWGYPQPLEEAPPLADYVAFYWDRMDEWYEEEEEVFGHPKDPYHRIDVLHSARHVRVDVGGVAVAESVRPRLLFETSLPTRYYLPALDVRQDLLVPSQTTSYCAYKGSARYYHLHIDEMLYKDYIWFYPAPNPGYGKIQDLLCFYNEKVDLFVDGEKQ